jgi:hypothetical protein
LKVKQLEQLLDCFEQQLPDASQKHIAHVLSACGHMKFAPLSLLSKLDKQSAHLEALAFK